MGFWGNDPAQVRDLLKPELMGIRVLPGDPLFEGEIDQIIEKVTFPTVLGVVGRFCWKFGKLALGFWRVSALVLQGQAPAPKIHDFLLFLPYFPRGSGPSILC